MPHDPSTFVPALTDEKPPGLDGASRWRFWLLGTLLIAALAAAALQWGQLASFAELLRRAQPVWLVGAVVLQLATYASLSAAWALVLRDAGTPRSLRLLLPLSVTKLFADQIVPSAGMSGNILLVDRLIAIGVPRGNAVAALLVSIIGYYAAYALLAIATLLLLWLHRHASLLLAATVSVFLLVAVAVPAFALWLQGRGNRPIPSLLARSSTVTRFLDLMRQAPGRIIHNPWLIIRVALFNALVFLFDAATLQLSLLALGEPSSFTTAFIAFIMASIAVTLGPIPLGLGSFEAVSVAMLRLLGVSFEAALSATLLFRGLTLWLPLLPGLFLTRRALRRA
ncbi:lysylphosphatidylglycerol synthase transmembrane domain-containing protein [Sphingopyxis chilensis]